jgi:antitoxin ParD1/3/4
MSKRRENKAASPISLQVAWKEGIDSGDAGEVDFSALKREARARFAALKKARDAGCSHE